MDLGIKGKWALVCGASKGLGLGCAEALVSEGVNVLIVARGADVLEAAVGESPLVAETGYLRLDPHADLGWRRHRPDVQITIECGAIAIH